MKHNKEKAMETSRKPSSHSNLLWKTHKKLSCMQRMWLCRRNANLKKYFFRAVRQTGWGCKSLYPFISFPLSHAVLFIYLFFLGNFHYFLTNKLRIIFLYSKFQPILLNFWINFAKFSIWEKW
jgi:hypothetical protein